MRQPTADEVACQVVEGWRNDQALYPCDDDELIRRIARVLQGEREWWRHVLEVYGLARSAQRAGGEP